MPSTHVYIYLEKAPVPAGLLETIRRRARGHSPDVGCRVADTVEENKPFRHAALNLLVGGVQRKLHSPATSRLRMKTTQRSELIFQRSPL
jgi:hypothetical protein